MFALKDDNRIARLFYDVTQFLFEFCKAEENNPELYTGMNSCDAVCLACILDESIIKATKRVYACVEPFGKLATGHMISDWYGHFKRQANVEIITDVDREKFLELFRLCVKEEKQCWFSLMSMSKPSVFSRREDIERVQTLSIFTTRWRWLREFFTPICDSRDHAARDDFIVAIFLKWDAHRWNTAYLDGWTIHPSVELTLLSLKLLRHECIR